jgi:thymidylate kinase
MGKRIRSITVEGADAVGKTTQLNLIAKRLKERNTPVHQTKLLGGTGDDPFQNAFRTILLSPKFPKDRWELEEQLFAITCGEATKQGVEFLNKNEVGVVVRDRGIASHWSYATAKGIRADVVESIFRDLIIANKDINRRFGSLDIILLPDNVEWTQRRIAARHAKDGVEYVARLENVEMQQNVVAAMRQVPFYNWAKDLNFELISVSEQDTIQDVQAKIDFVLARYEF